tara:strand:- start:650 stop:1129 length:480 start_codon:yes stop_codon:yes gene_type:complete
MRIKKSQVNMLETISVLAIFFVLVMLGLIFYSKALTSSIGTDKEESIQLDAIRISQKISFLPELQCSQQNIVKDNCIDVQKLEAMPEIIKENEVPYFDQLSFSRIIVNEIYPGENEWVLYDRPLNDYNHKIATNIPISIFDPIENKNAFGIINVETFSK